MNMDLKEEKYKGLYDKISVVLSGTEDLISSMATISSLVKEAFPEFLWVGFYRLVGGELYVGPYQGRLGCTAIHVGKGVCGKCVQIKKTIMVSDVHRFEGHIACDERAKSEIVVPVFDVYGELVSVLDIDSGNLSEFDGVDKKNLEDIAKLLADKKILV